METEKKFRNGESTGKPFGGQVSPEPFPQVLYNLAVSRGFESQNSFAKALGNKGNQTVRSWYVDKRVPTPEYMSRILELLQPNEEEFIHLMEPYSQLLEEKEKRNTKIGLKQIRSRASHFERWLEDYCCERTVSLKDLPDLLGISYERLRPTRQTIHPGTLFEVLDNSQVQLKLNDLEYGSLVEAVAQTIEEQLANGYKVRGSMNGRIRKLQEGIVCKTYNGAQAAKELGISREWVRQLRSKLDLPYLLTEDHIELLRQRQRRKP